MNTICFDNKVENKLIKPKKVDFSAILAVYKSVEGYWKGFAFPYDVTTQSTTKKETLKRLRSLVGVYTEEVKKYGSPAHLVHMPLTDLEDRSFFSRIVDEKIDQKRVIDQKDYHAETYKVRAK